MAETKTEVRTLGYMVDGEWRESKSDTWVDITDSNTGEVIARTPMCTEAEVTEPYCAAAPISGNIYGETKVDRRRFLKYLTLLSAATLLPLSGPVLVPRLIGARPGGTTSARR